MAAQEIELIYQKMYFRFVPNIRIALDSPYNNFRRRTVDQVQLDLPQDGAPEMPQEAFCLLHRERGPDQILNRILVVAETFFFDCIRWMW